MENAPPGLRFGFANLVAAGLFSGLGGSLLAFHLWVKSLMRWMKVKTTRAMAAACLISRACRFIISAVVCLVRMVAERVSDIFYRR